MRRLIVTTDAAGAGHLKLIRRGDKVFSLTHRLVRDYVPYARTIGAFVTARRGIYEMQPARCGSWDHCMDDDLEARYAAIGETWRDYDTIEFWADPRPNSQLVLLQFVEWFGRQGHICSGNLVPITSDSELGNRGPDDMRGLAEIGLRIGEREVRQARSAWQAFCQPTPEHWAALLRDDIDSLPYLRATVLRMLEELPDKTTGMGASEARMLALVAEGKAHPLLQLYRAGTSDDAAVLDYWELGKVLDLLSRGPEPIVLGLAEQPFDLALHADTDRLQRYKRSRLGLSALGHRLFKGTADLAEHAVIDRWWGGTRITNAHFWRWDRAARVLLSPGNAS